MTQGELPQRHAVPLQRLRTRAAPRGAPLPRSRPRTPSAANAYAGMGGGGGAPSSTGAAQPP